MSIITEQIKVIDLVRQKVNVQYKGELTLTDTYIEYEIEFSAEELIKNEELEIENEESTLRHGYHKYQKEHVIGISFLRCDSGIYKLTITIHSATDVEIYFENKKECKRITKIIDNWIFK